jgi:hypothetical protein
MIQYLKIVETVSKGQIYPPSIEKKVACCGKVEGVGIKPKGMGVCAMQVHMLVFLMQFP